MKKHDKSSSCGEAKNKMPAGKLIEAEYLGWAMAPCQQRIGLCAHLAAALLKALHEMPIALARKHISKSS